MENLRGDIGAARQVLDEAREYRAQWIMKVAAGEATIFDVIEAASQPYSESLGKIRLESLLSLDLSVRRRWQEVLLYVAERTYVGKRQLSVHKLNVNWLINPKANTRMDCFVEAYLTARRASEPLSDRFPWVY